MKTLLEEFKSDILNAIFKVSGKVWLKVTSAYAIQTIILTLLVTFFIIGNLGANFSTEIMQDPEALKSFMEEMMSSEIPANLITNLFLLMGVGIILGSWLLNFSLLITDSHIKEGKVDFGKTIGNSFNKNILTIAGTLILIGLIFTGGFVITGMVSGISGILGFLTGMAVCILIFKFILIIPALVLGKKSYGNAVSFSFQHITYTRCLKLFGITILVFLSLFVIALLIGLLSMAFAFIPAVGQIIQLAIQILFGGFMTALMVSALSGLYFRYEVFPEEKEELPETKEAL